MELKIVSSFNYLGVVLPSGGSFIKATNTLVGKALQAMNCLFTVTRYMQVKTNIMFNPFDTFALSILNYACEKWGFSNAQNLERVHRKFCKWLLNVKMSTNSLSLYAELGRFPFSMGRHIGIIKYWLSLYQTKQENCILRTINLDQRQEVEISPGVSNWSNKVKSLLERSSCLDVWLYPESVNTKLFLSILYCRLRDIYIGEWIQGVNLSTT